MTSEAFAEVGGAANVKTVFALQNVDVMHINKARTKNWMWQILLLAFALWGFGEAKPAYVPSTRDYGEVKDVKAVKADLSRRSLAPD